MPLFYLPDTDSDFFDFTQEESKHILRVLRLKKGDNIFFTDGKGNIFEAVIDNDNPKHCTALIKTKKNITRNKNYHLHIAVAPTKNISRFEWFLEKATEIGIDKITPLICEHSERKTLKIERLKKILISAMKQSKQYYLPELNEVCTFSDFIKQEYTAQKFIAFIDKSVPGLLKNSYTKGNNVLILIGPEGDFSRNEFNQAISAGYVPISLGENRLRTETAALVACFTINLINQEIRKK